MARWGTTNGRAVPQTLAKTTLTKHPTCQLGYTGCTKVSTQADHIIPHAEGGTNHPNNMQGVCTTCHKTKSRSEATRGARRRTARGQYTKEQHPGLLN